MICPDIAMARFIKPLQLYYAPNNWAATMIDMEQKYDASTVAVMRRALNDVIMDRRFLVENLSRSLK